MDTALSINKSLVEKHQYSKEKEKWVIVEGVLVQMKLMNHLYCCKGLYRCEG